MQRRSGAIIAPQFYMWIIISIAIIALDQITKIITDKTLLVGESIPVIRDFFHLTYVRNTGAAFGSFSGQSIVLCFLPLVLVVAGIIFLIVKRNSAPRMLQVAAACIIGGGIGNLIDRVRQGYVIDFLDFKVWDPVFNVADVGVCVGCGLLVLYVLFFESRGRKNGR